MKTTKPSPPSHLTAGMQAFWRRLTRDYAFSPEHIRVLQLTCEQFDRAQAARERIATDGMLLGDKRHPLLGIEAKATELFMRGLRDLQLESEGGNAPTK